MKYFNLNALNASIIRIREGDYTQEHRTGTAALGLVRNYFPVDKYAVTPKQTQVCSNRWPDLSIELFINSTFVPHCFVEVKSLVNSNFDNIVDQLFDTLVVPLEDNSWLTGNYSVFMIGIKGTKIAFYVYHPFGPWLDDYEIMNFKGFIPLNYMIPLQQYLDINDNNLYTRWKYGQYVQGINFETDPRILEEIGALKTKNIDHPHVLNEKHRDHIHNMFEHVANRTPGPWIKE